MARQRLWCRERPEAAQSQHATLNLPQPTTRPSSPSPTPHNSDVLQRRARHRAARGDARRVRLSDQAGADRGAAKHLAARGAAAAVCGEWLVALCLGGVCRCYRASIEGGTAHRTAKRSTARKPLGLATRCNARAPHLTAPNPPPPPQSQVHDSGDRDEHGNEGVDGETASRKRKEGTRDSSCSAGEVRAPCRAVLCYACLGVVLGLLWG